MQKNNPHIFRIDRITVAFLILFLGSINLHAATQILIIPFTVIPQSEAVVAQQINHTISFTLMHQPNIKIIQSETVFSSTEMLTPDFQKKVSQYASEQQCSHVIYGNVNIFGQTLSINAVMLNSTNQTVDHVSTESLNQLDQIPDWLNHWIHTALKKMTTSQSSRYQTIQKHIQIENIKDEIIGMDIADIDQDSKNEILLFSPKAIRVVDKEFHTIHIKKSRLGKTIVYARFVDNLEYPPFLVVSETTGSDINTGLYQWKENQWHLFQNYSGWFITVLKKTNQIIAQQRRHSNYWGDIMHMQGHSLSNLVPQIFDMPVDANIFDFTIMHANTKPLYLKYDKNDYLRVIRDQNLLWRSSQAMGGSIHFIEIQTDAGQIESTKRKYLPSRLLVCNLDNNPFDEVIVCENFSNTGRLFENSRWFSQGVVHVMAWTGSELQRMWTSTKQPGPVTAYALEKNGHTWQLWIACVLKQRNLFRKGLSRIAVYDIQ